MTKAVHMLIKKNRKVMVLQVKNGDTTPPFVQFVLSYRLHHFFYFVQTMRSLSGLLPDQEQALASG